MSGQCVLLHGITVTCEDSVSSTTCPPVHGEVGEDVSDFLQILRLQFLCSPALPYMVRLDTMYLIFEVTTRNAGRV